MSVEQLDVTALAFTSEQDDSRALLLIDLMSLLGFPPTCRAMAILKVFTPVRRSRRGGTAKVEEYAPGVSGMSEGPLAPEVIPDTMGAYLFHLCNSTTPTTAL